MTYLLDTHVFLWSLFSTAHLSGNAARIISDADSEVLLSVISFWEISLKYGLGKLELHNILPEDLPGIALSTGYEILPLNELDVASFYKLPKGGHGGSFDRLIIWQAIRNDYTLISADGRFNDYAQHGLRTLW